jgi:hypothetical protein
MSDLRPTCPPEKTKRHRWPAAGAERREQFETIRRCLDCGIDKVTRHEPGVRPWIEWRDKNGNRIDAKKTPACEPVFGARAAAA